MVMVEAANKRKFYRHRAFGSLPYDLLKDTTLQAQHLHQIPMHEFLLRLKGQICGNGII
ncbi:ATP-dependent transcriptional regulator [Actinobacillus pleuropneumoniae]|nr:ATP-dependent transcriptional regulator [Actinobacillus pleuropneumoniae]